MQRSPPPWKSRLCLFLRFCPPPDPPAPLPGFGAALGREPPPAGRMVEHKGSQSLFAIFALSIYSLFLGTYTIYRCCCGSDEAVAQPYLQV